MLKLKNVSKFYYSNGVVSSGFTKVNLSFMRGEFVAITGESGSGKSTLLNVISGLDTYEEGEMYINGEETSAYGTAEFENYRNKYIANIYQSFNLINSYTVRQNVEVVLLLAGMKKKERREKVDDILKKVDLYKFRNTKASRLSGGQKQRVAIARALVKDTPIIVADEPTGNLDSASAANVVELLSKLATDRLVVIVTHNYDQVEPYVTRKITMHDGRVVEDLVLRDAKIIEDENEDAPKLSEDVDAKKHHLKTGARLKLGTRNAFNIIPKFAILLFVFLFATSSVTALYANIRENEFQREKDGYNNFFSNQEDERIIIKKADGSVITEEDYAEIMKLANVDYIIRQDVLLDSSASLSNEQSYRYIYGTPILLNQASVTADQLASGRLPEKADEVIFAMSKDSYLNESDTIKDLTQYAYQLSIDGANSYLGVGTVNIVGVLIYDEYDANNNIILTEAGFESIQKVVNSNYSTISTTISGVTIPSTYWGYDGRVVPSSKVPKGGMAVNADYIGYFEDDNLWGRSAVVTVSNLYYTDSLNLKVTNVFYPTTRNTVTDTDLGPDYNHSIFINDEEYKSLFDKGNYQSSVFVKVAHQAKDTCKELEKMGYTTLYVRDSLKNVLADFDVIEEIVTKLWSSTLVVILFFVSYFIIKLVMKSRNVYFATVRMLGASSKDCKSLLRIDLLTVQNIAYFLVVGALFAEKLGLYDLYFVEMIMEYLVFKDFVVLYIVLTLISLLISSRYARKLFKSSAMNVYKEV